MENCFVNESEHIMLKIHLTQSDRAGARLFLENHLLFLEVITVSEREATNTAAD